ncbi:unnamed protein product [Mesocestoides corti]|uniref:BRCT domain-containing protein n=1 Tax=Mesocestoides corti TaxID=53468 RepID=A0A158QUL6_MESCO|nr:unnamed protein product [Mesocestoides corti]
MSTSDANELTRLCRKYRIPVPCQDLFSKWAIVRTTGIQSSGQDSIHVPSTNPNVTTQLAACSDPNFLQLLILGGGGQLLTSIDALRVSATGRLLEENGVFSTDNLMDLHYSERPHIALVAPSHKRTLKFLQGLAALGRVPLLRGTWLLDACLLAAGMEPIMPLDQSSLTSTKKPADLPYELLRRSPRVVYELSRGVDRITDQLVVATEVPDLYAELPGRPHLQTLLSLGGYASASLIAIITDDPRGFGEGWSSILRLAVCTYENVPDGAIIITAPPTVLSSTEAMDWLTAWKTSCSINGEPMSSGPQQIVLVDQERVPAFMLSRIETLGFTVVNKEYLIQSLINGRMVDLKFTWDSLPADPTAGAGVIGV